MLPSCYYLETTAAGTVLYLGEVSTEDCLRVLDPSAPLIVNQLGATVRGKGWFDADNLPDLEVVSELLTFLQARTEIEMIDFAAQIGAVRLSTHDDGEAALTFPSPSEALAFLRAALEPALAEQAIEALMKHPGKYIELGEPVQVFETFDDYVAASNSALQPKPTPAT